MKMFASCSLHIKVDDYHWLYPDYLASSEDKPKLVSWITLGKKMHLLTMCRVEHATFSTSLTSSRSHSILQPLLIKPSIFFSMWQQFLSYYFKMQLELPWCWHRAPLDDIFNSFTLNFVVIAIIYIYGTNLC